MRLGVCSRSNDVVEPIIKPQWYVNSKDLGKQALHAAESKKLEIIPKQYSADWKRCLYLFCFLFIISSTMLQQKLLNLLFRVFL